MLEAKPVFFSKLLAFNAQRAFIVGGRSVWALMCAVLHVKRVHEKYTDSEAVD